VPPGLVPESDTILGMSELTTLKVSLATRDQLREFANGESLDKALLRLLREARQRQMAEELAAWQPDADDLAWIGLGSQTLNDLT
jgi:hypothetical protein